MAALRPARASILVVEDDPAVTRALMDALERADYRGWHALNGVEARGQMQRAGLKLASSGVPGPAIISIRGMGYGIAAYATATTAA